MRTWKAVWFCKSKREPHRPVQSGPPQKAPKAKTSREPTSNPKSSPQMRLSLALSVTTGSRVTSRRASPPIEKGVPRHGDRLPRFGTGSICVVGSVGSVHTYSSTLRAAPRSPPSIVLVFGPIDEPGLKDWRKRPYLLDQYLSHRFAKK